MNIYLIDACALIAYLSDEPGADRAKEIIFDENSLIFMHKANLLEVYYGILKEDGENIADLILEKIRNLPIEIIDNIDDVSFKESARIKNKYKISLADCILLGEAKSNDYIVITADHHEFDIIDKDKILDFYWIR